ncbi:MAG: AMP-binding protein [Prolixibacteraceae bacterium]|nr:AMP-binding protein [Prolixibacteraceae bacterium]
MNLWEKFNASFSENASKNAFCIEGRFYSYREFVEYINGSQIMLQEYVGDTGIPVGVICHNSIETFAAIFAIWFSGCYFVPLHPHHPAPVNAEKIQLSGLKYIFDSETELSAHEFQAETLCNKGLKSTITQAVSLQSDRAYILFTSGSTGKPKGVPINVKNLNAFVEGFLELYPDLTSADRFLQTYDLTSDAAFTGYVIPLLLGASVYTIPPRSIKYLSIVKILQEQQITWTQFTPSVLHYLRPYLKSLRFNALKHSHFGGESLPFNLISDWALCVPNAEISNIYGPTETTITCTIHRTEIDQLQERIYNGAISIGKPLKTVNILILDENDEIVGCGEKGELCIGGDQVMEGYISVSKADYSTFFVHNENGIQEKYYRSGDLVIQDEGGYLFFCGRKDDQLKISGYRIEPAEIELAISEVANGLKSKVSGYQSRTGTTGIVAFVEKIEISPEILKDKLRAVLPAIFIPEKIISIGQFPLNSNGKIDKSRLFEDYSNLIYE